MIFTCRDGTIPAESSRFARRLRKSVRVLVWQGACDQWKENNALDEDAWEYLGHLEVEARSKDGKSFDVPLCHDIVDQVFEFEFDGDFQLCFDEVLGQAVVAAQAAIPKAVEITTGRDLCLIPATVTVRESRSREQRRRVHRLVKVVHEVKEPTQVLDFFGVIGGIISHEKQGRQWATWEATLARPRPPGATAWILTNSESQKRSPSS